MQTQIVKINACELGHGPLTPMARTCGPHRPQILWVLHYKWWPQKQATLHTCKMKNVFNYHQWFKNRIHWLCSCFSVTMPLSTLLLSLEHSPIPHQRCPQLIAQTLPGLWCGHPWSSSVNLLAEADFVEKEKVQRIWGQWNYSVRWIHVTLYLTNL